MVLIYIFESKAKNIERSQLIPVYYYMILTLLYLTVMVLWTHQLYGLARHSMGPRSPRQITLFMLPIHY